MATIEAPVLTREEKIERYIVRNAFDLFFSSLVDSSGPVTIKFPKGDGFDDINCSASLFNELWPAAQYPTVDEDAPDFQRASLKTDALLVKMYSQIEAAGPGWAAGQAAQVAERIAKEA